MNVDDDDDDARRGTKNVVLIRHGESLAQTAKRRGMSRKHPDLLDCFLGDRGIHQAIGLSNTLPSLLDDSATNAGVGANDEPRRFDLVCTSPLTRAVATCALAFGPYDATPSPSPSFVCHPGLAETGGSIPENRGRPVRTVLRDVRKTLKDYGVDDAAGFGTCPLDEIDFSLLPPSWPDADAGVPEKADRRGRRGRGATGVHRFLEWLRDRPERNVAVVCHHNVILSLLRNRVDRVENCVPIVCVLDGDGGLELTPPRSA